MINLIFNIINIINLYYVYSYWNMECLQPIIWWTILSILIDKMNYLNIKYFIYVAALFDLYLIKWGYDIYCNSPYLKYAPELLIFFYIYMITYITFVCIAVIFTIQNIDNMRKKGNIMRKNENKNTNKNIDSLSTINLENKLKEFVKDVCKDREPSHGYEHMEKVKSNSIKIYNELPPKSDSYVKDDILKNLIITVAWLHDVYDHKYDHDGKLRNKVMMFLVDLKDPTHATIVMDIIERISYSRENKSILNGEALDWNDVLGSEPLLVRNIVSDADKLEAIGQVGVDRCVAYTLEKNPNISGENLVKHVMKHADEKLLRLKDEFIRTEPGKRMAEPLHQEMIEGLEKLTSSFIIN